MRSLRLVKTAGSLATQEVFRRLKGDTPTLMNRKQLETIVRELGSLKGAAMKLGQIFALEARDFMPEELCLILDTLQSDAPPLEFDIIASIVRPLGDLKIEREPLAAASIGQVHRAQYQGRDAAVKIQYPGIRKSTQADVALFEKLFQLLSLSLGKKVSASGIAEELSALFMQETDYLKEASFQRAMKTWVDSSQLSGKIIVPEVFMALDNVLVSSYEPGLKLSQYLSTSPSMEERTYFGDLLLNLYTHEFCTFGCVQTDPNPGNFLFRPHTHALVALDFGACKEYSMTFRRKYAELIVKASENNPKKLIPLVLELDLLDPRESPAVQEMLCRLIIESMRPIMQPSFSFADTQYPETMRAMTRELIQHLAFSPPPRSLLLLHRKLSGIFQIIRQLKPQLQLTKYFEQFANLQKS